MEDTTTLRPPDDIAAPLYPHIDWARCAIGGSHALQQYMRAKWPAAPVADIDVSCQVSSAEELVQLTLDFLKNADAGGRLQQVNVDRTNPRATEMVDAAIVATADVVTPDVPVPVQFIGVYVPRGLTLLEQLDRINALPAAVTYTVRPYFGRRLFHLSDHTRAVIAARRVPRGVRLSTSEERRAKYERRGFEFE